MGGKKKNQPAMEKALQQLDLNQEKEKEVEAEAVVVCAHCNRSNPSKRCSKRHAKCMKKMFCDDVCEKGAHKVKPLPATIPEQDQEERDPNTKSTEADAEAKAKAKAKAKKARKAAKTKSGGGDGEFWWNNSVFASW